MADIPSLLKASLIPTSRKQAEQSLNELSIQPGFLSHLLRLVLDQGQDQAARLSGGIYLKNVAKLRWEDDERPLLEQDKASLRSELVPAMLMLSNPSDKAIRAQVAESVSLIAELDFPLRWPDLIDQLVASLSTTEYNINIGVLQTAHSIFRHWRAHVRSDELYSEINLVLSKFMDPFLQLFRQTSEILIHVSPRPTNYALIAQSQVLLIDIFYDFTCQDLPPAIEDSHEEFFAPPTGLFQKFLAWDPEELRGDPDDIAPSVISQIKTGILEISELFIKLYPEQLQKTAAVEALVQAVWALVGANKLPGVADDALVSQSLRFISTAVRSGFYKSLFGSRETISSLVQGVVVPNVSLRCPIVSCHMHIEHELDQFSDDPLEYIRLDLSLTSAGTDAATRRQAAADVLQALVGSGLEAETTEIVGEWVKGGLKEFYANKTSDAGWKAKDAAVFLFTAIAARGSTTLQGVTSTNTLVDVVDFFSQNVLADLQADSGSVHPILQVDAIRYLYTFRNQLTKEQLLAVLPMLGRHLGSENYVTYTYSAITIDRILFIKRNGNLLFAQADIQEIAPGLLNAILIKIESAGSPEKVAENDHLMKCAMRVIVTARETLRPGYEHILQRLVAILGVISKNPSNPHFDQYIFESIAGLMRFVVNAYPDTLPSFEQSLFGPFTVILQQDIDQYIPFVFQILAQMLELHKTGVPSEYRSLLPFLLTPAIWQQKGSIPGLVKLLKAFLAKDSKQMVAAGQFTSVLAVVQQRLIPSKINDAWGFELLHSVVQTVPPSELKQYLKVVIITLLTRMQKSKTDKFVYLFAYFMLFTIAVIADSPDYLIAIIEEVQPQLWQQILTNFIIPQVPKMPVKDRRVVVVGLTRLLTQSPLMLRDPTIQTWPPAFIALAKIFLESQYLATKDDGSQDASVGLTEIDYEEQTAGYQAAYSRLAASESAPVDPVANVRSLIEFLGQQLVLLSKSEPRLSALINAASEPAVATLIQTLGASGCDIRPGA